MHENVVKYSTVRYLDERLRKFKERKRGIIRLLRLNTCSAGGVYLSCGCYVTSLHLESYSFHKYY